MKSMESGINLKSSLIEDLTNSVPSHELYNKFAVALESHSATAK